MINLIPNEEKHKKVKDFYFRFSVVFLAVLGLSTAIAAVAILPSYFLSSVKINIINSMLESQKNEPMPVFDQQNLTALNDFKAKMKLVEKNGQNEYFVSEKVINEILLKKMPDIKITGISFDSAAASGKIISVDGTAVSRERLLLFRRALEDDVAFQKVDLPISNFIKGSNIKFSLTLVPS